MATAIRATTRVGVGAVSAYVAGDDIDFIRSVRAVTGRITVVGGSGLRVLSRLAEADGLSGMDLDPAPYTDRQPKPEGLFDFDWIGTPTGPRIGGRAVVRSPGVFVSRRGGSAALRRAFEGTLPDGVVRVVSIEAAWWLNKGLAELVEVVRACDDPLAFVLAAQFDPLDAPWAIPGLLELLDAASPAGRPVELLRTDTTGIAFAANGGSLGAIGLGTGTRHHGLPLGSRAGKSHEERQHSPLVFVEPVISWQRGPVLGALTSFGGGGLTDCACDPCDGRSLLRFDTTWSGPVPATVRALDARSS